MYLAYYVPETLRGALHVLLYQILTYILRSLVHCSHYTDEETHM